MLTEQEVLRYIGKQPKHTAGYKQLVHDLEAISLLRGAFHLSKPALEWGTDWYERHYKNRPRNLDNERFSGYLARKQTHVHKLAMVLSAAYKNDLIILKEDLEAAAEIITSLEADMPQVFELIGVEGHAKMSTEVLAIMKIHKEMKQADLFRECFKTMSWMDFQNAVQAGMQSKQLEVLQVQGVQVIKYVGA